MPAPLIMAGRLAFLSVLVVLAAVVPSSVYAQDTSGVVAVNIDITLVTRSPLPTFSVELNVRNFETV